MKELIQKIEQWANDRNIIKGSKPIDQAMKLFSEFGELADNVGKGRDCRDDIGDVFVVLTIISAQYNKGFMLDCFNSNNHYEDLSKLKSIKHVTHVLMSHLYSFVYSVEDSKFCKPELDLYSCLDYLAKIAELSGATLEECVQIAYNDISKRQGILWNGVFVKNTDENFNEIKSLFEKSIENNLSI